jgi:uncharacterized protein YukE
MLPHRAAATTQGVIMANIHVTYADMQNASTQLATGRADIDAKLIELKNFIDNLVSEGYVTSQSSLAFQEQFSAFIAGTQGAIEALTAMGTFLQQAAQTMEQTDIQLAAAIRQ